MENKINQKTIFSLYNTHAFVQEDKTPILLTVIQSLVCRAACLDYIVLNYSSWIYASLYFLCQEQKYDIIWQEECVSKMSNYSS